MGERGVGIVEPEEGILAGGDVGRGRLAGVESIISSVELMLTKKDLKNLKILITAGGTREPIDPVRYITNKSSGKQGYALAQAAYMRGADVTLVTSMPDHVPLGVDVLCAQTAKDMEDLVMRNQGEFDVIIMAAAIADFRPAEVSDHKIKKTKGIKSLELEKTHDFLIDLGQGKRPGQTIVGFAAETEDLERNAIEKLKKKNLNLIVANNVSLPDVGFSHDTNEVTIISEDSKWTLPLSEKRIIADGILDAVLETR